MAEKAQGDKMFKRLADKTRVLTIKVMKARALVAKSEEAAMHEHDRDCFGIELRAGAQKKGGGRRRGSRASATR